MPRGGPPPSGWRARPRLCAQIDPRLRPLREMFARVDAVAERAGRLTQGARGVSGTPAIVTPVDGQSTAITFTKSFLEGLTVIPLTLFFLLGGPPLLARLGASLSGNEASARTLRVTEAIRYEVGRYFGTVALINIGLGAVHGAGHVCARHAERHPLGRDGGVVQFRARTSGPIAAFFILSIAALLTFESLGHALAVPGVFLVLHLIEGQIVQPLTVGRRFEVNALVVLLAVWFGYGFWGIPGMLLAMPVVVAVKVAAQYQPSWRTVRDFLSPDGHWHPRSLKRVRIPKKPGPEDPAAESDSVASRGG